LPVLTRQIQALQMVPAQVISVQPPNNQPVALPGDTVVVKGQFLSGAGQVTLASQRLGLARVVPVTAPQVTNTTVTFTVPSDLGFLAGIYSLAVQFFDANNNVAQTTNSIPLAVAPAIDLPSVTVTKSGTKTTITLTCSPVVAPSQTVYLAVNGIAAEAQTFDNPTTSLTFEFTPPPPLPTGAQPVVLQVDEVSSLITFHTPPPFPAFGPTVTI